MRPVQRDVTINRCVELEREVQCGCEGSCDHVPTIEEVVVPRRRPPAVGLFELDRAGLAELARRRGYGVLALVR